MSFVPKTKRHQACVCITVRCVRVVILDDGLETISRGWDSVGRRLAGAATHTLSLPALDDEIEPLHPPKTTTATPTSATQASSGQGPAQHPNSHCRWIRRFTFKPLSLSLSIYSLYTFSYQPETPSHLPTRIFAGSAEISIEFLHVF
jgi:hypothetical protein